MFERNQRISLPAVVVLASLIVPGKVPAFDYDPTPLAKALAAHDLVFVAKVKNQAGRMVSVEAVSIIKGKAPDGMISLPDTWRPHEWFTFGPVRLEVGKTYLLMLNRGPEGTYTLSKDFAAPAAVRVKSTKAPLVRAVVVTYSLSQQQSASGRQDLLAQTWDEETDETKRELLEDFYRSAPDPATIPFLLRAVNAALGIADHVIQKHQYKEAIPGLLKILKERDKGSLPAAHTLAVLKARQAYEPIMAMIDDPAVGNREYLIEALAKLEDRRAIPFFIKTLTRNLPGLDPAYGTYRTWSYRENEAAVRGLGRLRAAEAVEPLIQLLQLEPLFRNRVLEALVEIGPPARAALPKIRELMKSGRIPQDVATWALKEIER